MLRLERRRGGGGLLGRSRRRSQYVLRLRRCREVHGLLGLEGRRSTLVHHRVRLLRGLGGLRELLDLLGKGWVSTLLPGS